MAPGRKNNRLYLSSHMLFLSFFYAVDIMQYVSTIYSTEMLTFNKIICIHLAVVVV